MLKGASTGALVRGWKGLWSGISDSKKLRVLFNEDSNFLTELATCELLPKVESILIGGDTACIITFRFIAIQASLRGKGFSDGVVKFLESCLKVFLVVYDPP